MTERYTNPYQIGPDTFAMSSTGKPVPLTPVAKSNAGRLPEVGHHLHDVLLGRLVHEAIANADHDSCGEDEDLAAVGAELRVRLEDALGLLLVPADAGRGDGK